MSCVPSAARLGQRSARPPRARFKPERPPGPDGHLNGRHPPGFRGRTSQPEPLQPVTMPRGMVAKAGCVAGERLLRCTDPPATNKGGCPAAPHRTGRRLMRQTQLPISAAAKSPTRAIMAHRLFARPERAKRIESSFGLPLTPESGGPSPNPAARLAPADRRAFRRREFSNAKQDVDRCHPSGRNPGRGGPRQSR